MDDEPNRRQAGRIGPRCVALGVLLLTSASMLSEIAAAQNFKRSNGRGPYVHDIDVYDASGRRIDAASPGEPYSPSETCKKCHDVKGIAHGWHFNAAGDGEDGRGGEPWVLADARTGTQIPLSYREWPGVVSPDEVGLTPTGFAQLFGRHLPGGLDTYADGALEDPRRALTGGLEIDCMACHDASRTWSVERWNAQVEKQNFAWAPAAAAPDRVVSLTALSVPHLDAFAAAATRHTHAVTPSSHTHPAIASLLTGAPPLEHGSLAGAPFLDRSHVTLAEHCSAHGYATAGFLDNPWLHGGFGLERGYAYVEASARPARIERWLDRRGEGPFLLHVHFFHPHGPYDAARAEAAAFAPPGVEPELVGDHVDARAIRAGEVPLHHGFAPADLEWMRAMQAAEVRRMDDDFGALMAALEERGLFDRAVVVVASDHGEEFGERGGLHHSHTLFGELVDVPLLVRRPARLRATRAAMPTSDNLLASRSSKLADDDRR